MLEAKYKILALTLTLISSFSALYIFLPQDSGKVLAEFINPMSFESKDEIDQYLQNEKPQLLNFSLENTNFSLPIEILEISYAGEYMELNDNGISYLKKDILTNYEFDVFAIIHYLPFEIDTKDYAYMENGFLYNCSSNAYNFRINYEYLESVIRSNIDQGNANIEIDVDSLLLDRDDKLIFEGCKKYTYETPILYEKLKSFIELSGQSFEGLFGLTVSESKFVWKIKDPISFQNSLEKYAEIVHIPVEEGSFDVVDNQIYLFSPYSSGKTLDTIKTLSLFEVWLNNPKTTLPFVYKNIEPKILSYDRPIIDFTKNIGSGQSRMIINYDGKANVNIPIAQKGLEEIHNHVINPGEEFSYYDILQPTPFGKTAEGNDLKNGICNSTTTIFRAALEAGLPITERQGHTFWVGSYQWGYPENIVDSTFYANPKVDLRFLNDTKYPILMRFMWYKGNDNFQYHVVSLYSDPESPDRSVNLSNWKKWNVRSDTSFSGSFDRIVYQNGEIIRQDTFVNNYQ